MQQIHVKRYEDPKAVHFQGCVEPEDRSWALFIDAAGQPSLFIRAEMATTDGKTEHGLLNVLDLPASAPVNP